MGVVKGGRLSVGRGTESRPAGWARAPQSFITDNVPRPSPIHSIPGNIEVNDWDHHWAMHRRPEVPSLCLSYSTGRDADSNATKISLILDGRNRRYGGVGAGQSSGVSDGACVCACVSVSMMVFSVWCTD